MIVDEDLSLESSKYITNLIVEKFRISLEDTVGDTSYLNGNNRRHNISIHNMVRACLILVDQYGKKRCCES